MKRQTFSGKIEEVIYARLEAGEDLLPAIWDICKQHDVKTGVLLDATGSMEKVRLQRFPHQARKGSTGIDIVEIPGQLEVRCAWHHRNGLVSGQVGDRTARACPIPVIAPILWWNTRLRIVTFILWYRAPRRRFVGTSWRVHRFAAKLGMVKLKFRPTSRSLSQKFRGAS